MTDDRYVRWSAMRTQALNDPEEAERLRVAAKDLERVVSDPGWEYVHRWLATEQQKTLNYLLRQPGNDRADTYALKKAHAAGYCEAMEHAFRTPGAILGIAMQVAEAYQRAAEAAEE